MDGESIQKNVVMVVLSLLVSAFVAGITAFIFLENRITAGVTTQLQVQAPAVVAAEVEQQVESLTTGAVGPPGPRGDSLPVGSVVAFWGDQNHVPDGFVACMGQELHKNDYPELHEHFQLISPAMLRPKNKFVLPDLRGEFIRGLDLGRNVDYGRILGQAQKGSVGNHIHEYNRGLSRVTEDGLDTLGVTSDLNSGVWHEGGFDYTESDRDKFGKETRPRNVALMYMIKATHTSPN